MAEIYTCLGIGEVDFTPADGNRITGVNIYYGIRSDDVVGVRIDKNACKFFISDANRSKFSYIPDVGNNFTVSFNRYGKPEEFVQR